MIEVAVILSGAVRHWAGLRHHPGAAGRERASWVLGGVPGRQRHRRAQGASSATTARVRAGRRRGSRLRPGTSCPATCIRLRLGDIVPADARLLDGDPVEVDQSALTGESLPATRKPGEAVYLRFDPAAGRDRRPRLRHRREHLLRQDRASWSQDAHTVSHFQRAVLKIGNYLIVLAVALVTLIMVVSLVPRRPGRHHAAVRAGADRGGHPRRDADRAVGHDGRRCAACWPRSRPSSAGWSRSRNSPAWTCSAPTRPAR